jgi:hypothetical protein
MILKMSDIIKGSKLLLWDGTDHESYHTRNDSELEEYSCCAVYNSAQNITKQNDVDFHLSENIKIITAELVLAGLPDPTNICFDCNTEEETQAVRFIWLCFLELYYKENETVIEENENA